MSLHVTICPTRNPRAAGIVAGLLRDEPGLEVALCESCAGGRGEHTETADVVVLTAGLPDMRDLAQLQAAVRQHRFAPLVVLSVYDDPAVTRQLLAHGASALLPLDQVMSQLPRLIRRLTAPAPARRALSSSRLPLAP